MSYTQITPRIYPLEFQQDRDWKWNIPVVVDDDGTLMDFTGMTAKAQVRRNANSNTVIVTFSSYDMTLFLVEGEIQLDHPKEDHASVEANDYVWDCVFYDPDGRELGWIKESPFKVTPNVTSA